MKTRVSLTVDVEPSVAGAFAQPTKLKPLLEEPVWGRISNQSHGLGFLIETLERFDLTATFFVEALHTNYFGNRAMAPAVEALLRAKQDVQLHLHPLWLRYRGGQLQAEVISDNCAELTLDRLTEALGQGMATLADWTGQQPTALRTGNFSTERHVYTAMAAVGLTAGSNVGIGIAPPEDPTLCFSNGVHEIAGVTEVPATSFQDVGPVGRGRYRLAQVTACSYEEMTSLLNEAHKAGLSEFVILTHPFEFFKKSDAQYTKLRPNRLTQGRFTKLCQFLSDNTHQFEVVPLSALAQSEASKSRAPMDLLGNPVRSIRRAVENRLNDLIWLA